MTLKYEIHRKKKTSNFTVIPLPSERLKLLNLFFFSPFVFIYTHLFDYFMSVAAKFPPNLEKKKEKNLSFSLFFFFLLKREGVRKKKTFRPSKGRECATHSLSFTLEPGFYSSVKSGSPRTPPSTQHQCQFYQGHFTRKKFMHTHKSTFRQLIPDDPMNFISQRE